MQISSMFPWTFLKHTLDHFQRYSSLRSLFRYDEKNNSENLFNLII